MFSAVGWIANILGYILTTFLRWILDLLGQNPAFLDSARYKESVEFFFTDTIIIFLMLIIIIFIVSIIRSFFPPERTRKLLGEGGRTRGFIGNIFAALLGIVTPFCSCSAVPVFIGFLGAGIPLGVTFSFLIASPMINEVAVVMLWSLFGWKIALLYMATGLTVAIVAGAIIGKLKMEKYLEEDVCNIKMGDVEIVKPTWKQRITDAWSYDLNLVKKIWPYIIIGLVIGAAIHGWAPGDWLAKYAGRSNPLAVPLAVLIGIPLYSNAAGTLPIVSELTKVGVPMGTALAFMMAVTALSLPEMIILRKVLKPKLLAVFVGIMAITIIFIGYFFNIVLV
ncbi:MULTISPECIES: permease [unclassified Dehalobacter]|uniref:permease n=1 Tax=unclassified Dehalobacter TaxID=2635733 RepID=UPI00028AEF4F|nr:MULTISPECIES: permease [unclassified Dehalobacter]AFV01168.1 Transporter [Dehalobacter sp. DCA]AFV04211.1 Transporter [Dehalobacter sp. CF]